MKNILIHMPPPLSASVYYRAMLPYRHCHKQLEDEGIKLHLADQIRTGSQYDAVVVRREVNFAYTHHLNQRRKKDGTKIVWDIDDDFWSVPDWSPVKYDRLQLEEIDLIHSLADVIWASTETLAKKCGDKSKVLPNLADFDDWFPKGEDSKRPIGHEVHRNEEDYEEAYRVQVKKLPINILWSGSSTHRRDIEICSDAILHVADRYPGVKFHFYGYCPEPITAALYPNNLVLHEWTPLAGYWKTLRDIQPTISLAPLVDCEFNRAKSNIRWIEGTLAGAAVIASDCEAYKDAYYKVDHSQSWHLSIAELVESSGWMGKTESVRIRNHEIIAERWSWQAEAQKDKWMNAFRNIVS